MRLLILTDHITHSNSNSFYVIANGLFKNKQIGKVLIASRGDKNNSNFFAGESLIFHAMEMKTEIGFNTFHEELKYTTPQSLSENHFDAVLLRIPRPVHPEFFRFLSLNFDERKIVNRPSGIIKTGSKAFLLEIAELCAPIRLINSFEEIKEMADEMPIVLKPLEDYGGRGIIKIENGEVFLGNNNAISMETLEAIYEKDPIQYLGMKYLKNVVNGDKRIVVANGVVLTVSIRYPAKDSWLCNVSQGGSSELSKITKDEAIILDTINPILKNEGIFIYGIDTLEDDQGKRVLSEINTLSVGGVSPGMEASGIPLNVIFAEQFVNYFNEIAG